MEVINSDMLYHNKYIILRDYYTNSWGDQFQNYSLIIKHINHSSGVFQSEFLQILE